MKILKVSGSERQQIIQLSLARFHSFAPMKAHVAGIYFSNDDDVKHEVSTWLWRQTKDFYASGTEKTMGRVHKCYGGFVNK